MAGGAYHVVPKVDLVGEEVTGTREKSGDRWLMASLQLCAFGFVLVSISNSSMALMRVVESPLCV
jgi:hypothetical protein